MDSMAKQRRSREWARRLGASLPMRIMHHGLGSLAPPHTRMWHEHSCTQPQLPSDVVIPIAASVPSCSEPSRTRPFGWRYAPSLTAPALDGESISAVGARESPAARVEQEKWTWREKKSRLIDNFVLAFCVAISERRNGLPRSNKETDDEIKCVGPPWAPLDKVLPIQGFLVDAPALSSVRPHRALAEPLTLP